jgi:hypothetical protein
MVRCFGVVLVFFSLTCNAADTKSQPPAGGCDNLAAAVESGAKELSFIRVDGAADNSAARESNRQLQKVVATNLMQMNLSLMQANRCNLPRVPFSDSSYYLSALSCSTALLKSQLNQVSDSPAECDRSKWTRMSNEK